MLISGTIAVHLVNAIDAVASMRNSLFAGYPVISQTAGTMLVTAIWQGAVVATFLSICLGLTNRVSAALRFTVWTAGFLAVVALPFLPMLLHLVAGPTTQSTFSLATNETRPLVQLDIRWSIAITLLWAAASLYRAVDLAVHARRLRTLWKNATPVESDVPALAKLVPLRGRRAIQICTTNALDRPSVIGFFAPRILIPEWLFARLTVGELDQILLHETEHLRRGDDWTNLLQKLSLVIFPLNPVLLWIERKLCLEREMACDEAVIRVTHAPKAYAACLTGLAEHGMQRVAEALSLGAWQRRPELVHRIHSILRRRQAIGPLAARSLFAVLACGLGFGSVELARCPQLIAFTAARPIGLQTENASLDGSVGTMRRENAAPVLASASNRPYLTELKATMPVRNASQWTLPKPYQKTGPKASARKLSTEPAPGNLARTIPMQESLEAGIPDASSIQPQTQQEQSWIVLTTWEEVDLPVASAAQNASATDLQHDQMSDRAATRTSGRVSMTQLILRVLPANSVSTSPTAMPIRSGWLVIQL
jgi:bla regulator protein blaR1